MRIYAKMIVIMDQEGSASTHQTSITLHNIFLEIILTRTDSVSIRFQRRDKNSEIEYRFTVILPWKTIRFH